jgi:hypothetical protein
MEVLCLLAQKNFAWRSLYLVARFLSEGAHESKRLEFRVQMPAQKRNDSDSDSPMLLNILYLVLKI